MKVDMAHAFPWDLGGLQLLWTWSHPAPQREQPLLLSGHGVVDSVVWLSRHK